MSTSHLRHLPSVEKVLTALGELDSLPRPTVVALVRDHVEHMREELLAGSAPLTFDEAVTSIRSAILAFARQRIQPVINGTGVMIHTNLGRSPIHKDVMGVVSAVATGYCNLELDLNTGERGSRGTFLEKNLATLCEAEAATVVNNCAAALVLILRELANGDRNEVIIGRNQLVEIGGGFRIPEILETSGARLREVGATNKVSVNDYRKAINARTGMILRVHRSNFYMEGFVDEPTTAELVALAREFDLPVVEDLGSGAMVATDGLAPLDHEPTTAEVLADEVDLVCVSGDKLFGGPQAGIIAGKREFIARLKQNPFFRALRCDKMVLTALQESACAYLKASQSGAMPDLPLIAMLNAEVEALNTRAAAIVEAIGKGETVTRGEGTARCGGGTMPKSRIPSVTIDIAPVVGQCSLPQLMKRLRDGTPPVIGYVSENALKLDLRTIPAEQDSVLIAAIRDALQHSSESE
ncbi:MAG: L-seryl-tRNA(Sec) selenium transferase [Verrucomicrobia bacterium]|nr:L-seryl-tRNA(Sec) selenium transferase [Verrucomicrobiota bacterium]